MSDIVQGSDEWKAARLGKVTASRVADVIAKTKTGYSASRANYMSDLIIERLTGSQADGYTSPAMQWGIDTEPQARAAYELMTNNTVTEVGFIDHPEIKMTGASPDGLIGESVLIEIKCPNSATHIDTLLGASVPQKYFAQIQWQLECTNRTWCDFVSFDPRMPVNLQMFVKRIGRDDEYIAMLRAEISKFLAELASKLNELANLTVRKDAA